MWLGPWDPRLLTSVFVARQLGHALRRAQKIYSGTPGFPANWLEGLDDGTAVGFAMDLQSIRYVDMTGKQHTVDPVDFDGAFIDPLGKIGALDCQIAFKLLRCPAIRAVKVSSRLGPQLQVRHGC